MTKYIPGMFYSFDGQVYMFEYTLFFFDDMYHYFINVETNVRRVVNDDRNDIKEF